MGNTQPSQRRRSASVSQSSSQSPTSPASGYSPRSPPTADQDVAATFDHGRLVPFGLYPSTNPAPIGDILLDYDRDVVRDLVLERRLAPFYKGLGDPDDVHDLPAIHHVPKLALDAGFGKKSRRESFSSKVSNFIRIPGTRQGVVRDGGHISRALSLDSIVANNNDAVDGHERQLGVHSRRSGSQTELNIMSSVVATSWDRGLDLAGSPSTVPATPAPTPSSHPGNNSPPLHPSRFRSLRNRSISVVIASKPASPTVQLPRSATFDTSNTGSDVDADVHESSEIHMIDASVVDPASPTAISASKRIHPESLLPSECSMLDSSVPSEFPSLVKRSLGIRPTFTVKDLYHDPIECPICFLHYPRNINFTRCCRQPICTECFLQIRRAIPDSAAAARDEIHPSPEPASCPYCIQRDFGVFYHAPPWVKLLDEGEFRQSQADTEVDDAHSFVDETMIYTEAETSRFSDDGYDFRHECSSSNVSGKAYIVDDNFPGQFISAYEVETETSYSMHTKDHDAAEYWWGKDKIMMSRPMSPDPSIHVTSDDVRPELLRRALAPPPTPPSTPHPRNFLRYNMHRTRVSGSSRTNRRVTATHENALQLGELVGNPQGNDFAGFSYAMRALGADLDEMMMAEAIRRSLADPANEQIEAGPSLNAPRQEAGGPSAATGGAQESRNQRQDTRLDRMLREVVQSVHSGNLSTHSSIRSAASSAVNEAAYLPASTRMRGTEAASLAVSRSRRSSPEQSSHERERDGSPSTS